MAVAHPPVHHVHWPARSVVLSILAMLAVGIALLTYVLIQSGDDVTNAPAGVAEVAEQGNWDYSQAREHLAQRP